MKKATFEDDGRVIAPMDFDRIPYGFSGNRVKEKILQSKHSYQHEEKIKKTKLYQHDIHYTGREKLALMLGLYQVIIPIALLFFVFYFIAFVLMDWLWL